MKTTRFFIRNGLIAFFCAMTLTASAERVCRNINRDWTFRFSHQVDKNSGVKVQLPHTWNAQDALSGKQDYKRGIGNYTKSFVAPDEWKGRRLFVRFEGANSVATVFLNGKWVGEHRGGYSAFVFELTNGIKWGTHNELLVRVNNAEDLSVMPLVGDFNFYGGIYRDVELIATDEACISPMYYGSPGVFLTTETVSERQARISLRTILSNRLDDVRDAVLKWRVTANGSEVTAGEKNITLQARAEEQSEKSVFTIDRPRLWDGRRDPFLYDVDVSLWIDGREVDCVRQPLGIRTCSIDAEKGFFLNGRHLSLQGVCRHQERAQIANALRPQHHEEDVDIMLEMGVNAVRLAHYQQADYMYDLTDRHGILAWAEIPFVGPGGYADKGFVDSEAFRENGRQQLLELICQLHNHPSIFCWGLFNELKEAGDNPVEYIRELNELAHRADPSRPTTSASNQGGDINYITDLIAWNRYDGWYGASPRSLATWLDKTHAARPDLRIGISEYGAGASVLHQQDSLRQPAASGWWHPENWQTYYHMENWKIIHSRPYVWGSFVWNMFDFGAAHRTEGDRPGINDKGLVTHDRATRKDAFYFYKANWNPAPMLHIAGKRASERLRPETEVMVFSNAEKVELFVNGQSAGVQRPDDYRTCRFAVKLRSGSNRIEARAVAGKQRLEDHALWMLYDK